MSLTVVAAVLLGQIKLDPSYMIHAAYPAGSLKADTVSPGGNAESSNMPKPMPAKAKNLYASIVPSKDGVTVKLVNGSQQDEWFRAADGNMLGWLEALEGKEWKPIEYHFWYTCGNSYHRVALPPQYGWTYERILPKGTWKTQVRWVVEQQGKRLTSNELTMSIPRTRTSAGPGQSSVEQYQPGSLPVLKSRGG